MFLDGLVELIAVYRECNRLAYGRDLDYAATFADLMGEDERGEVFHYAVRFRNDGEHRWSWTASGATTSRVERLTMAVIDSNANGRYDDFGVDRLAIGSDPGAGWVSRIVSIDGKLFEFEIDGSEFLRWAYTGETGLLSPRGMGCGGRRSLVSEGGSTVSASGVSSKVGVLWRYGGPIRLSLADG